MLIIIIIFNEYLAVTIIKMIKVKVVILFNGVIIIISIIISFE